MSLHRRVSELGTRTSVPFAPPQREFGMRHVGDPLAVGQNIGLARRQSGEVDGELLRLAIQADQIEPPLLADHEQFLSIAARSRITEQERPHRHLRRLSASFAKKMRPLTNCPDVLCEVASRFKQEVFSIWRPSSAKLLCRLVPALQKRVQILPVGRNLPQRGSARVGGSDREAYAAAVGRKSGRKRNSL